MLKRLGPLKLDKKKSEAIAKKVTAATTRIAKDPKFIKAIEADPEKALKELGFVGEGVRTFRLYENVSTKDSCSCSCFPIACGTGIGCFAIGAPGSSSYVHD